MGETKASKRPLEVLAEILRHSLTRVILSVAIVVSLLPILDYPAVDGIMLITFTLEFFARAVLLFRREGIDPEARCEDDPPYRTPSLSEVALLGVDLVALLSFVPWQTSLANARWLRVFRLARLLLLFRYWAPVAKEMWPVMVRHERGRQVALLGVLVLVASFTGAVVLDHVLATPGADFDGDDEVTDADTLFWARMWWAFRQVQDPGNMLASPSNIVAILVSLGLTVLGLFLVSFLIGLGTDVVRELLERSRLRAPGFVGHTVVFHYAPATKILLGELSRHYDKMLGELDPRTSFVDRAKRLWQQLENVRSGNRYVVVGHGDTPPDALRDPSLSRVVWRATSPDHELMLKRSDVGSARRVILMADQTAEEPDDATIRTVLAIAERVTRDVDDPTRVVAEVLDESNVPAARHAIARVGQQVYGTLVPTERLLGLYVGAIARMPEVRPLLDELMTTRGNEVYCFDFAYPRLEPDADCPRIEGRFSEVFERAFAAGVALPSGQRVVPIGVISDRMEAYRPRIFIEPTGDDGAGARIRGFVGVTSSFRPMQRFTRERERAERAGSDRSAANVGAVDTALAGRLSGFTPRTVAPHALAKVVVCGWRPGTVNLVEVLLVASPAAEVLVMVDGDKSVEDVLDAFDSHANLVKRRMLHGRRSYFVAERVAEEVPAAHAVLRHVDTDGRTSPGRIVVRLGDRTSTRALADLSGQSTPTTISTVSEADVVVLLADTRSANDARTVTALMKIESILLQECTTARSEESMVMRRAPLRVIAEVEDEDLARRLSTNSRRSWGERGVYEVDASVFSIQQLRARFVYQSVAVPHFYGIFAELLAPFDKSIVPVHLVRGVDGDGDAVSPTSDGESLAADGGKHEVTSTWGLGTATYAALARSLWRGGHGILIGVDLGRRTGTHRTLLGEGEGEGPHADEIDLDDVQRLWVIRRDPGEQARAGGG